MTTTTFSSRRHILIVAQAFIVSLASRNYVSNAFAPELLSKHPYFVRQLRQDHGTTTSRSSSLHMAKTTKKKNSGSSSTGLKGFGSVGGGSASSTSVSHVALDRSKEARAFYDFLEKDFQLRGVIALKPIKRGDVIIRIPYELAVNLGQEGADPTLPAVELLRDYCQTMLSDGAEKEAYYRMLPAFGGEDCMGSTDFFSDEALEALQSPLIVEETLKRREKVQTRFQLDVATDDTFPTWIDGNPVTAQHLLWAVWLITSRVLTVQGNAEEGKSYRLLIPFLDMCNHDRSSSHILTGRAESGGELKVVAGSNVKKGDAIDICYGGGMAGNDRFLQDYGFLDDGSDHKAYNMVAQQLLGKRRIVEGIGAGRFLSEPDRIKSLEELGKTSVQDDQNILQSLTEPSMKSALKYRIGIKEALVRN
ncbi:SET methyltransferase domain containing protein [Nitzschia inconspicua]|uniref:SET methyltransferase domain containing protein n=1 Tax=Nitzschia inconspicua TaxID=303405 RepID=A0A9K3P9H6_9STRA|nr:SET methyltransferase domain containing protein [Nitzschia inconspicua]